MVMAGAFYPHYFVLQSGNERDERESFKILNGKDPYNTVYLTNMDNRQPGALYTSQIKSIFASNSINNVDVEFDSNSRYNIFTYTYYNLSNLFVSFIV